MTFINYYSCILSRMIVSAYRKKQLYSYIMIPGYLLPTWKYHTIIVVVAQLVNFENVPPENSL
jgi:hypothetical protein